MKTELKYVVTEDGCFAIFHPGAVHKEIANTLYGRPVGAGFCNIRQQADSGRVNIHCYGESISLNLESREEDEIIINNFLNH